jgi:hypothetical protein
MPQLTMIMKPIIKPILEPAISYIQHLGHINMQTIQHLYKDDEGVCDFEELVSHLDTLGVSHVQFPSASPVKL